MLRSPIAPPNRQPIRHSAAKAALLLLALACLASAQPVRPGATQDANPAGLGAIAASPDAGKAAVRVGTVVIRKGRIDTLAAMMAQARGVSLSDLPPEQAAGLRRLVTTNLIGQELLELEAKARNIRVTPQQIDSGLAELKAQFPDAATWQRALRQSGDTEAEVRARIARQIRSDRVLTAGVKQPAPPTEAELRAFWEQNKSEFPVNDSLRALQIVLMTDAKAPAATAEDKKRTLERVRADLATDSANMEMLVRRFMVEANRIGEGPEARLGGDMGRFHPDDFHADFRGNIKNLPVGRLSPVFRTPLGYHLVLLVEKYDGRYESYRLQVIQNLNARKNLQLGMDMRNFLKKLAETHKVTYLIPEYRDPSESGIY